MPSNRPREPLYKISDEISEASEDEDQHIDVAYEEARAIITPELGDANFSFEPEVRSEEAPLPSTRRVRVRVLSHE